MDSVSGSRKRVSGVAGVFIALVAVFLATVGVDALPAFRRYVGLPFLLISGAALFLLGVTLIFLTLKQRVAGMLKKFLVLTGACSAGLFVSFVLHNLIYGLFIRWFGADFWDRIGVSDEPFFFIMAVFVCPIGFLFGTVGSAIMLIKKRRKDRETPSSDSGLPGKLQEGG